MIVVTRKILGGYKKHTIHMHITVNKSMMQTKNEYSLRIRMMYYSVMTQANSEKEIPSVPIRSRTSDLPITSSDALPLSYRRLVGAKAIKLGSWNKHPVYCKDWHVPNERKCDVNFLSLPMKLRVLDLTSQSDYSHASNDSVVNWKNCVLSPPIFPTLTGNRKSRF